MQKLIYLDYNSTTPVDPRVIDSMLPYFKEEIGNPSNTSHALGWAANTAVQQASQKIASLLNCNPQDIVWNAGATEGNNSVVFGLIRKLKSENPNAPIHFITSNVEHWCVLNSFSAAEEFEKIAVTYVPANSEGLVNLEEIKKHIRPETKLVSLIWVNNEIGAINPIHEIATYCHENKIYFHSDATQAVGKIEVDLQKTPVHFLTFSAHKFCGPKGVGALVIKKGFDIEPYIYGGGQQNNRRSGTLNVPGIVGAGKAAEICAAEMKTESTRTRELIKNFWNALKEALPTVKLNGPSIDQRSPANLSLVMPKMIDLVRPSLLQLAFSQGSACQAGEADTSHVLKAIGLTEAQAYCTIRLSIGRFTTQDEMDLALKMLINTFKLENTHSPNVTN
jgi:cysteine desulfurase